MAAVDNLCDQLASATVEENEKAKEVSFSDRKLKVDTESDAREIVEAIFFCPGMTTLRLDGNTIGVPGAKAIGKALEKQPDFKNALWKDMFTQRTVDEIPQALSHLSDSIMLANAHLVHLDLSDNAFGPRGLIGIVKLLESPSCFTLQELHLNNNGLGISGAKMLAEALCNCVDNSKKDGTPISLKVFVCGRNRLENEGATAMSKFFAKLGSLESVAMPQNGIYTEGVEKLAESFKLNPNLKVINLEDNTLREDGAKHIAKCLPSLKHINMLNFGDCIIKTQGAIVLAEALKLCCGELKELYLGFNEIGIEGGKALVEAMENKKMLQMLVLNGNGFGEEGCEALRSQMAEYGLEDNFGTLSDDEGDDNEEDDNDYENGEEPESDSENKNHNVSVEILENSKHSSPMQMISPADFYAFPTSPGLLCLYRKKENLLSVLSENPSVSEYLNLFMKVCMVAKVDDDETIEAASLFADEILTKAIHLCSDREFDFTNEFLVCLRMIKSEDEKYVGKLDISGPFTVLPRVIKKAYFPKATRDVLQFFLSRPLNYATVSEKARHGLLQAIYQM